MRIKTFFAKSMGMALQQIKAEMGPEALILTTREIPSRSGVVGAISGIEVVAAVDAPEDRQPAVYRRDGAYAGAAINRRPWSDETGDPQLYFPAATGGISPGPTSTTMEEQRADPVLFDSLYRDLIGCGVDEWLARKLLSDARGELALCAGTQPESILESVNAAARKLIGESTSTDGLPARRIVFFVGPTGVGKTTTLAKLAAMLALRKRKKVALISLDGYRIGGAEQLRTYASLTGLPFRFVERVSDLPGAIQDQTQRDYILIDTTGRSPRDFQPLEDLAGYMRTSDSAECHLVLSATTKAADLCKIIERFEICRPDHLLFTKLDETSSTGPLLNELVRTRMPMRYYANGQRVPEDLHPVPDQRILDLVLNAQ